MFAYQRRSGFKNAEFKRLDGLYIRAVSQKLIFDRAVDVDMDEGVCRFSYYRTPNSQPYLTFIVRHVGPKTNMYEVWLEGKGRVEKSGLFDRAYERLEQEITNLSP